MSVIRLISQTAGPHFFYASTEKTRHSLGRRQSVTFMSHSDGRLNCASKKARMQTWRVFPAKFNSSIRTTWVEHLYPNLFTEHSANKCINFFFFGSWQNFLVGNSKICLFIQLKLTALYFNSNLVWVHKTYNLFTDLLGLALYTFCDRFN